MGTTSKGLRYPESNDAPAGYQQIQNLASDVNARLFTHAGSTGAVFGSAAATGAALVIKTIKTQFVTNASGDASVTYPGGEFPTGVLAVSVITATTEPFVWVVNASGNSRSVLSARAYNIATGTVAGSLSIAATVIAVGY